MISSDLEKITSLYQNSLDRVSLLELDRQTQENTIKKLREYASINILYI
jgi:hypothetical protein